MRFSLLQSYVANISKKWTTQAPTPLGRGGDKGGGSVSGGCGRCVRCAALLAKALPQRGTSEGARCESEPRGGVVVRVGGCAAVLRGVRGRTAVE